MSNKNKDKLVYDLKIREAIGIRKNQCGPDRGLNEDFCEEQCLGPCPE
jgi:hypothetical protein